MTSRVVTKPKYTGETRNIVFDFTSELASAETISGVAITLSVYSGTDLTPAVLSGNPTISGPRVTQKVQAGIVGVTYAMVCEATTSAAQVLSISTYLTIVPNLV
jgi:hypothetical protein